MDNLEQKFADQLKAANAELTAKLAEFETQMKEGAPKSEVDALKAEITSLQDQLSVTQTQVTKFEGLTIADNKKTADPLQLIIKENFEQIRTVRKGHAVRVNSNDMTLKAVANMTLGGHLTGDQFRDYSETITMKPGQALNVADLIGSVTIEGGTYTHPRETTSEGSISKQTEGNDKSQIDYDVAMIDVNTDFIAGFAVYSKKMANNLPFLESFLPMALRRDYFIAENSEFNSVLAAGVTASTQVITGSNKVEMLVNELATLEAANYMPNVIVVRPADFYDILLTEKSTGAGYGLPGVVTWANGNLFINGVPVLRANWLAANKYYVGDFTYVKKVITEGLSVDFSEHDEDNFRKNNITARVEAQVGLAIHRTEAVIYGDFSAT